jgi:hypothetical protein
MKSALWLPLFDELADPLTVVRAAAESTSGQKVVEHLRGEAEGDRHADA